MFVFSLWLEIESVDHSGIGEVIIYNCHHTWVRGENDEEVIKITSTLDKIESTFWSFDYVVLPHHQNTYFAPIKHMIDTGNCIVLDQTPFTFYSIGDRF